MHGIETSLHFVQAIYYTKCANITANMQLAIILKLPVQLLKIINHACQADAMATSYSFLKCSILAAFLAENSRNTSTAHGLSVS